MRECLLTQLRTLDEQNALAMQIVSECLPKRPLAASEAEELNPETPLARLLQANQLKEIARALNRPVELVKRAVDVIKKLDPRPGLRYNKTQPRLVEPDVYFRKVDDQWQVFMNDDDVPQLRLSPVYRRLLARDAADREVRNYVKERVTAAMQLMKSIEQRKHTILRVCQIIIQRQFEYLDHGADHLKPMMIKEVAEEVGVHPSTVSRAVSSKYAHTPQGVLELRSFFSESVNGPGRQQHVAADLEAPREENDRRRRYLPPAHRRFDRQETGRRRNPCHPAHRGQISRRSPHSKHAPAPGQGVGWAA